MKCMLTDMADLIGYIFMHVIPNGGPSILYILTTIYAYQSFARQKSCLYIFR